ncbi:MAG: hypothetical protein ACH37H_14325 [Ilumatobacteraceae bacterium]|mgnify:FL=1|nr:hypothetical protein [Ilumatobacteraceae bacterium]HRA85045.1 hypothetical protein [Ilumatobacteraceae bacterium]
MPNFFDAAKDAIEHTADAASEAADDVAEALQAAVDEVGDEVAAHVPAPADLSAPHSFASDASIGSNTPIFNVGAPDLMVQAPTYDVQGPSGSFRVGDMSVDIDIDNVTPGDATQQGGVVVGGSRITIGVDAPGLDATVTGEEVFTTNPMVVGVVPKIGGPALGGSADINISPDELPSLPDVTTPAVTIPAVTFPDVSFPAPVGPPTIEIVPPTFAAPDLLAAQVMDAGMVAPGFLDVGHTPTPAAPSGIPVPYPNVADIELPDVPTSATLEIDLGNLGAGSPVPVLGAPDVLLEDPDALDLPDLQATVGELDTSLGIDPIVPGDPTAHGGVVVGGAEIGADLSAPGVDAEVDLEAVAIVDPMITGIVPDLGGVAVGGEATVEVTPVEFDEPEVAASQFEQDLAAIDDTAEQFDIFD